MVIIIELFAALVTIFVIFLVMYGLVFILYVEKDLNDNPFVIILLAVTSIIIYNLLDL